MWDDLFVKSLLIIKENILIDIFENQCGITFLMKVFSLKLINWNKWELKNCVLYGEKKKII